MPALPLQTAARHLRPEHSGFAMQHLAITWNLSVLMSTTFQSALQGYARYKQYDYRAVRTMHCDGCCRRSCSCGNIVAEQLDKTALIGCIWHARMQNSLLPTTICRFEG